MKKYFLKTIAFLLVSIISFGQSKDDKKYMERATEVQEEVWSDTNKEFQVTAAPDKYKNESAVVLARSVEVTNSSRRKYHFGSAPSKEYKYFTTVRERVLINDKSALEEFSTLNYRKLADRSLRASFSRVVNTTKTYVGAKIFKRDGKVITVNAIDEEVLTKNSDKTKEGKIAIPDLQTGDVMDYYYRIEEVVDDQSKTMGPDIFFLADDHPILYYHLKYILDKHCGADVMNVNGAKPLTKTVDEDDNTILEFTETDLAKLGTAFWTSEAREIPYYIIRYGFPGAGIMAKNGEVREGPFTETFKRQIKSAFIAMTRTVDKTPNKSMDEYFNVKRNIDNISQDTIVDYLYNYYRWAQYGSFTTMDVSNDRNYNHMNWFITAVGFCEILKIYEIKSDIVLVNNRYSSRLDDIFSITDFEPILRVTTNTGKIIWLSFNGFFQDAGQLAADYQGEDALVLTRQGRGSLARFSSSEDPEKLPVAKSTDNVMLEKLKVNFTADNLQQLNIERTCNAIGAMKQNDQKKLLLAEDVEAELASLVDKGKVTDNLLEHRKTKGQATEIQAALDNERLKQKDYFKEEIKDTYDQDPKELISYKINNSGLSAYKPAFEYTETFTMENFVKKAGNNYILDIGKLMGTYKRVDDKEKDRKLDVYMPSARRILYDVTISIPDGYQVKGIDELNKKTENDIASFQSTAKVEGNTVKLTIARIYNNNFEPASNWPKLVSVIDATADFTSLKLLLEKKK